jgi:hypothetical protein
VESTKALSASRSGREPLAVVHQLREGDGELLLFVGGHLVQAHRLQILVGLVEDGAARRLVHAAALHAHQPVFHDVQQADAVFAAQLVELVDYLLGAHLLAVHGRGHALFKLQLHICGLVRSVQRRDAHLQKARLLVLWLVARILKIQALVGEVPQVLVLGVVGLAVDLQGHVWASA